MATEDLRREGDDLYGLITGHGDALATTPTPFKGWTGWDVVAHLHHADRWALASARGQEAFDAELTDVMTALGAGRSLIEHTRETFAGVPYGTLVERWATGLRAMCDALDRTDPDRRLPWFGPPMKVRMMATARQMEVWAHGQALYDVLGLDRAETDRVENIVFIGVRTFEFCFANRQRTPPGPMPYLELTLPSGKRLSYGAENEDDRIRGAAVEFAQVVTQTRNVADTALDVQGPTATAWMAIAQCFAGPPEDPPAAGTRFKRRP